MLKLKLKRHPTAKAVYFVQLTGNVPEWHPSNPITLDVVFLHPVGSVFAYQGMFPELTSPYLKITEFLDNNRETYLKKYTDHVLKYGNCENAKAPNPEDLFGNKMFSNIFLNFKSYSKDKVRIVLIAESLGHFASHLKVVVAKSYNKKAFEARTPISIPFTIFELPFTLNINSFDENIERQSVNISDLYGVNLVPISLVRGFNKSFGLDLL